MTKTEILIMLTITIILFGIVLLFANVQINNMTVGEMPIWLWYILN